MKPSDRKVRKALKDLRTLIETSKDPMEQRIAYGMETAIRWVTEDTVGWSLPADDAKALAKFLKQDLRHEHQG